MVIVVAVVRSGFRLDCRLRLCMQWPALGLTRWLAGEMLGFVCFGGWLALREEPSYEPLRQRIIVLSSCRILNLLLLLKMANPPWLVLASTSWLLLLLFIIDNQSKCPYVRFVVVVSSWSPNSGCLVGFCARAFSSSCSMIFFFSLLLACVSFRFSERQKKIVETEKTRTRRNYDLCYWWYSRSALLCSAPAPALLAVDWNWLGGYFFPMIFFWGFPFVRFVS